MYTSRYNGDLSRKLSKLKKKDPNQHSIVYRKIDQIIANPDHRYKDLHYTMKGIKRVHIGHFVLIFRIDHKNKIISFDDHDHHDKIY